MRDRLISYINDLFASAPDTPRNRELHDEIMANNLDKYDDLVREGTPENAAFNLVVGGMGDVTEILREINREKDKSDAGYAAEPAPKDYGAAPRGEATEGKKKREPLYQSLNGLLWALVLVTYFVLSFSTGAWHITWLTFLIGVALSGVLRAIFDLVRGDGK